MTTFPVLDATNWTRLAPEQMGTKRKFWCRHPAGYPCLFKFSRSHSGEHWSEKIVAEIADCLGLPRAEIELATVEGYRGTISRDFTEDRTLGNLVHGNELLLEADPGYPSQGRNFRVAQHTLDRIFTALSQPFIGLPYGFVASVELQSARDVFVGYLALDALVANTDRHHANWAILEQPSQSGARMACLAPTFDHASSLGRELTDARRAEKLRPLRRDQTIIGYLESDAGRSRIYADEGGSKPLRPLEVFQRARLLYFDAAEAWLARLEALSGDRVDSILDRIPLETMSDTARSFARRLISLNRDALVTRTFQYG